MAGDGTAGQRGKRRFPQLLHQRRHLGHAVAAREGVAVHLIEIGAVLGVKVIHGFAQVLAPALVPGGHFADEHRGNDGVLIPDVAAGQIAVAFLKAEKEPLRVSLSLQTGDLFTNVLEAGEHLAHLHAVVRRHGIRHGGGNDAAHGYRVLGHPSQLQPGAAEVIQQQYAHLIAGDEPRLAVMQDGGAYPVAVGIGGQQQIRAPLFRQLQPQLHRLQDLRVGIGAGGKVAVGLFLLRYHGDIGVAHAAQHRQHGAQAGAV